MTEAFKCDRCDEFFENLSGGHLFKDPREREHPVSHLCPACHTSLQKWWEYP